MQNIICDTNIWYDIANGRKSIEQLSGVHLIGTSVNITEISSTPNLLSNIELVARTVNSMRIHVHEIVISNPIEYLISLFHSDFKPDTNIEMRLLEGFNILKDIDVNSIPAQNVIDAEKQIKEIVNSQREFTNTINEGLLEVKKNIEKHEGIEEHSKLDFIEIWKKYFSDLVLEYSKQYCVKEYELDINSKSWDQLEFFLYTWESYFKNDLEIGKRKFDKNDWGDLFNLVYVYPGSKYWTSERKWNLIFNSNERLRKYNFST